MCPQQGIVNIASQRESACPQYLLIGIVEMSVGRDFTRQCLQKSNAAVAGSGSAKADDELPGTVFDHGMGNHFADAK